MEKISTDYKQRNCIIQAKLLRYAKRGADQLGIGFKRGLYLTLFEKKRFSLDFWKLIWEPTAPNARYSHKARLLWCGNLTRKRLTAASLLLVRNDFRFLGFQYIFPTGKEGECFFIDRSTNMYYASWPTSAPAQIQYNFALSSWNFWL